LGIFCCNIGSDEGEVRLDPAADIENNVFDFNEGAEVSLSADRRAHMRPGEAGLDVLEADTVSLAVACVVLFRPVDVRMQGLGREWLGHDSDPLV